jgi:UDP-GlcNAc:undecaprenyl-phosphate GlcNAc-1-phosphate transferase
MSFPYLGILLATFCSSYLMTWIIRKIALARGAKWVAMPKADRWHDTPTALHGGIGIFLSWTLGIGFLIWAFLGGVIPMGWLDAYPEVDLLFKTEILLLSVGIIFVVGLIDDFFHLKPVLKLLGELVAVSIVIFLGVGYQLTPIPWFDLILSYFWFIGIINAVNLLDNMDGISSGIVMIGALGVALLGLNGYMDYTPYSVFLAGILVASALGFWLQNKPPAKIFMGDSGSLVLGFVFAAITIPSEFNGFYVPDVDFSIWDKVLQLCVAISLAAIPILDTTLVTVTRLMRGQSPSIGGKDHSTHRLAQSGLTHWQTLTALGVSSSMCVAVALFMVRFPGFGLAVFTGAFVLMAISAVYLASVRIQVAPIKKEGWQQLVTSVTYRIPLIKMVLDILLIGLAFYFSYLIRFDFALVFSMRTAMFESVPIVIASCLVANFVFRVYDFSWRSASSRDILNYGAASVLGTLLSLAVVTLVTSFDSGYSRGAFVIFSILYFLMLSGSRFSYRLIDDLLLRMRLHQSESGKIPLIIYGSSSVAKSVVDEINHDQNHWKKYRIIGIVDTTFRIDGKRIQGVPVRTEEEWIEKELDSQPEILVVDDGVDNDTVKAFVSKMKQGLRVRRYTRNIVDIL